MKLWEYARSVGLDVTPCDNSCVWGSPGGMGTNGGCRCGGTTTEGREARMQMRLMARALRAALDEIEALKAGEDL
jgi:hypothetical protein